MMETTYNSTKNDEQQLLNNALTYSKKSPIKYWICIVILVVFVIGVTAFAVIYVIQHEESTKSTSKAEPEVCHTEECYNLASEILSTANFSVDPCSDFWHFTCDGWWEENNFELIKRSYYSSVTQLNIDLGNMYLDSLFYDTESSLTDHDSVQKAITFYESCYKSTVNDEDIETNILIAEFINIVNFTTNNNISSINWNQQEINGLNNALSWLNRRSWNDLFLLNINNIYEPLIMQSSAIRAYGSNITDLTKWNILMNDTFIPLYQSVFDISLNEATQISQNVLLFMSDISDISTTTSDYTDYDTLSALQESVSFKNNVFGTLFGDNNILNYTQLILNTFQINNPDLIENVVYYKPGISFFNNFTTLISNTPPQIIQYFLFTNVFYHYFNFKDSFIQSRFEDRKDFCLDLNKKEFPFVFGWIINQKYFYNEHKEAVIDLINDIMDIGMVGLVNDANWMDQWSRNNTLKKIKEMRVFTGIPPRMENITNIDYFYSNISFLDDENNGFLNNYNDLLLFDSINFIQTFRGKSYDIVGNWPETFRNPGSYNLWLTGINAFYNRGGNWQCITQTYSQKPYFSIDYPMLFNYAALGRTIGHETNHGFDPNGVKHNYNGTQTKIWTNQTENAYNEFMNCFINQYSNISIPKSQNYFVNGTRSITENVADNGGMQSAYYAWQVYKNNNPQSANVLLPGVNLTTEQLFWFQYGRSWCDVWRDDYWLSYTGVHSPRYARLIGVIQNMPQFAQAYNCPIGSPMNPVNKCKLW